MLAGVIVAVNVTDAPKAGELGVKVRAVVVEISLTGTVTAADVLDVKVLSPEYCAVIELEPTRQSRGRECAHAIGRVCPLPAASCH